MERFDPSALSASFEAQETLQLSDSAWKKFKMTRVFRGKKLTVAVRNPAGVQKGVKKLVLNGTPLEREFVSPAEQLPEENQVEIILLG